MHSIFRVIAAAFPLLLAPATHGAPDQWNSFNACKDGLDLEDAGRSYQYRLFAEGGTSDGTFTGITTVPEWLPILVALDRDRRRQIKLIRTPRRSSQYLPRSLSERVRWRREPYFGPTARHFGPTPRLLAGTQVGAKRSGSMPLAGIKLSWRLRWRFKIVRIVSLWGAGVGAASWSRSWTTSAGSTRGSFTSGCVREGRSSTLTNRPSRIGNLSA